MVIIDTSPNMKVALSCVINQLLDDDKPELELEELNEAFTYLSDNYRFMDWKSPLPDQLVSVQHQFYVGLNELLNKNNIPALNLSKIMVTDLTDDAMFALIVR